MESFIQQLINGFSLGAIYALIALGYTMVYGVLRFINFAHADVFMLGAFIGYYAAPFVPAETVWGGLAALAAAMLGCACVGILIERLAYRPLRTAPTLNVLITAIGVSLLLEYSGQVFFGATPRTFPTLFPVLRFTFGDLVISSSQALVIAVTLVLVAALQWGIYRTRIGTAMRAVSQNPRAAMLMGINNNRIISFTFALGSALAGAGGILYALNYPSIDPLMGVAPGLKAFTAAILGGIGNIPGAALGGLVLGIVETLIAGSALSTYKDAIAFTILLTILFFRPAGLLGKRTTEKVYPPLLLRWMRPQ